MGNAKLVVKLVKENQQLKEDAERYQTLFLEMEQKNWVLEERGQDLQNALKELRAKIPENEDRYDDQGRLIAVGTEKLSEDTDKRLAEADYEKGVRWRLEHTESPAATLKPEPSASEPIIDLDDESIEMLVPEQDCGD